MNRFVRNLVWGVLLLLIGGTEISSLQAQTSVFNPNDPIVVYNSSNPPTEPPFGQPGKWVKRNRVSWNTTSFKAYIYKGVQFRLKWPKNYDASGNTKYPLFIFFHGRGEWGNKYDNEYQLYHGGELHRNAVDNGLFNGFLLYPQASVSQGPWSTDERRFVMELVENFLIPELYVDPFRVSVDGLSAGGLATWNSLKEYPKLVAACLPISNASSAFHSVVIDNKFTPIWLFQGSLDQNPKPASAQNIKAVADNAGGNFTYTEYPDLGHGAWYAAWGEPDYFPFLNRANKANPWPLYGRTEFCNTGPESINTTIGVTAGFDQYQWRKDGVLLTALGTSSNTLTVTDVGVYSCRIRKGTTWSEWSPIPVEIKYKTTTIPPTIKVSGLASKVLPAPDGKTTVSLEVPSGYAAYRWEKVGSTTPLSTTSILVGATVGDYKVQVTEQFGCSSAFTDPFKIINADGPNKPDQATGLIALPLSYTSLKLNWSSNPNPVYPQTGFEIYQANQPGGPYQFISLVNGNVFSFIKEGLIPGAKYYYIVRAVNNTAAAPVSNEASATTQKDTDPPTAPGNLHVTGSTRSYVSLAWSESTDDVGMDYYEVYVNGVKSYVTSEMEYTVYGLDFGKLYNFTVKAVDIAGNKSASSNQVTAEPLAKGLTFKHYTGSWDNLPNFSLLTPISTGVVPNVTLENASQAENYAFLWEGFIHIPENGYYVFSSTSDDGSKIYLDLNSGHTSSPYNHTATALVNNDGLHGSQTVNSSRISLSAGVYPIAITFFQKGGGANMGISWRRVNQNGNTTYWSGTIPDSAFVDPPSAPLGTAPVKPSDLSATAVSFKRIDLAWTDNSNNEQSFELYRSTDPLDGFITIGVLPANTTSFADTLVEPATTYYYKMRAINQYGESPFDKVGSGVDYAYYERTGMTVIPDFNTMTPVKTGRVNTIGLGMQLRADNFALKFEGYINITTGGDYTFYLNSDDGSRLYIDDSLVVDYDGLHAASGDVPGQINNLSPGVHAIRVTFFEAGGDEVLIVKYQGPGIAKQNIPADVLGDILANATTLPAPPAPAAPGSLVAVAASSSVIKTGWVNNATNATGIELYRSYDGNSDYVLLAELSPNTKSYNDTALYPGSLFYYKVRAVGDGGNSEYSNEASARTRGAVPTVLPIENVYVRFSSTVVLPIETTSASPTVISLQVSNLPGFAEFQQTENGRGTITFTPSEADQGVYNNIIVTATNPQNDINTAKFNVTVNANYVPVLNSVSNISVNETQTAQINLSVTDQDANDYLSWTFAGLPGFAIASPANRNASIAIAPKYGDAGVYTVKATVNDGRNGKDTTTFKITVVHAEVTNPNDGTAPIKPGNVTAQFVGNDAVKVSWTNMAYNAAGFEIFRSTSLTGYYTILNPGATNKDSTTYYDYTATGNNTYFYVVRAINANGGNNSAIVKIITPNTAPIINVNDIYIKSGNTNNVSIIATDDPGDIITLAASNLPSFVTFTDNGNGNGTIHLAPTGAYIGTYEISVKASDQYGAAAVKTIKIIVTNRYITSVFVNFNNKDYPVSYSSWNSFNAAQVEGTQVAKKTKISNLKEETGSITTLAVELPDSWPQHYGGVVTGNNSGIYPDSILMSGYYFFTKATVPQKTIRISGLDSGNNGKRYNLVFFGSRSYTSAQITYFTVGGQTVSLDATGNSTNTVQINNLLSSPEGVIDVIVNADMDKYAVINAMVIEEYDEAVFLPPFNLNMTKSTRSSISLSWKSNATDVTAFEVWRSDAPTGTYVKLPGTIPGNVFTYTDDGLTAGAVYYYKVRAVSGSEFSDFSDYISAATIKYEVNINLNDGIGPQPLPWNNTDLMYNGYTLTNLVNDNSLPTGINFTVIENFSGFNNWGMITGNNSGVVPDNVMKEFYYSLYAESARVMIDGLSFGNRYNFVFYGNCDNRLGIPLISEYTIGEKTVTLNAVNNTQNTVQINDVEPDAQGRVFITFKTPALGGIAITNSISIQAVPLIGQNGGGASPRRAAENNTAGSPLMAQQGGAAMQQASSSEVLTAYPVPVVDDIMLRLLLNSPVERLEVTLMSADGRPLYSQELRGLIAGKNERKLNVNARSLLPGVYFIRVSGWKDGTLKMIKILK